MRTELATADSPPLRPFSRHMSPTRSEPSQWNGSAIAAELVAAGGGVVGGLVLVGDVAEHVAVLVLRPRQPEVGADAPVQDLHLRLGVGPTVDAAEADEPAAVDELVLDAQQAVADRSAAGSRRGPSSSTSSDFASAYAQGGIELVELGGVELLGPHRFVGDVARRPLAPRFEDAGCRGHAGASGRGSGCPPRTKRPGSSPVGSPSA